MFAGDVFTARNDAPVGLTADGLVSFGEAAGGRLYIAQLSGTAPRSNTRPSRSGLDAGGAVRGGIEIIYAAARERGDHGRQAAPGPPFRVRRFLEETTVFHITHYKAGSRWVFRILKRCVGERLLQVRAGRDEVLKDRSCRAGSTAPAT